MSSEERIVAGDYKILSPLSEGGMGSVFVAEQISTGRKRALKLMRPELSRDAKFRERFTLEAKVGSRIDSEHVVEVVSAGIDEATGSPWLAMELLDGEDLSTLIARRGALPLQEVITLFEQLGHALSQAHAVGIVHRDLKPENLFIAKARRAGAPQLLKILDFGIAKLVSDVSATGGTTAAIGTPLWMAPEQAEVKGHIGVAADIWPLGLIAYHALTAHFYWRAAEESASVTALLKEILIDPIEPPSTRIGGLPPGFDDWFLRCVVRAPNARFGTVDEAIRAFAQLGVAPREAVAVPVPVPAALAPTMPFVAAAPVVDRAAATRDAEDRSPRETPLPDVRPNRLPVFAAAGALALLAVVGGLFGYAHWSSARSKQVSPGPRETVSEVDAATPPVASASATHVSSSVGSAPLASVATVAPRAADSGNAKKRPPSQRGATIIMNVDCQCSMKAEFDAKLHEHWSAFNQCYETALAADSTWSGRVGVIFTINDDGRVLGSSDRKSTFPSESMRACVRSAIAGIAFPAPSKALGVIADFDFSK